MRNLLAGLLGRPTVSLSALLPEVAELPVASNQSTAELIAEIHHSFNSVGDKLLAEAQATLAGTDAAAIAKGERLKLAGFANTRQAQQSQQQAQAAQAAREQQALIMDYALRYPTSKFITRAHVDQIAAKYNLVVGDTSAYTGFVPEKNLHEIEMFNNRFAEKDKPTFSIQITEWRYTSIQQEEQKAFVAKFPTMVVPADYPGLIINPIRTVVDGAVISSYNILDGGAQLICAPARDMDVSSLTQQAGHWFKTTQVHVPDPVVLQPVKGGYLIVTAWGDEASDPLVLNEQQN